MKQQLQLVFELNQLDLKIHEFQEGLEKIPASREELESQVQEKKVVFEKKKSEISLLEKTKRDKEGEVELAESRLKEFQLKLSQIKTNKEYQAALKEITETKKSNKAIEDQILEVMTKSDLLKKETQGLEESIQGVLAGFEKEKLELEVEEKRLQGMILEVEQEKKNLLPSIEAKVLNQYQRIKKFRMDAVTFVESGACQGCNMHIPPQLTIEIQKSKALHTCPSCHRILYLREWQEESTRRGEMS